ncbi:hypothetical protein RWH43_17050 [Microbacterium sp. KSW2-21]|uniref:Uncharacterized protein n=1 Tax=Microbacterium algihabitans TaxID=3075992 RepID=A0ABU3S062_9MICO|nr:hypothetical protein [Microbacterium sp. KSW2-21]MDU0328469.1 hypothetical protein [Microbacterium sp. KSW2-21]
MSPTIERLHLTIAGITYALAPMENVEAIKTTIIHAVHAGGGFLNLTLDSGQFLSVLVTPTSVVTLAVESVRLTHGASDGDNGRWASGIPFEYDGDAPYDFI